MILGQQERDSFLKATSFSTIATSQGQHLKTVLMSLSLPFPCPLSMSLSVCLGLECVPALVLWIRDCYLSAIAQNVFLQSVPQLWYAVFYLIFMTVTLNSHYLPFYFNQISRLPHFIFFFFWVEFVIFLELLWHIMAKKTALQAHLVMMEWHKYLLWLCRQQRKWMFNGFANCNTAVYKIVQLKGNLTSNEVVREQ